MLKMPDGIENSVSLREEARISTVIDNGTTQHAVDKEEIRHCTIHFKPARRVFAKEIYLLRRATTEDLRYLNRIERAIQPV